MKRLELTQNKHTIVDDNAPEWVFRKKWTAQFSADKKHVVAVATFDGKLLKRHRLLTNAPKDKVVDHINGDTLDNRLDNLRVVSQRENIHGHRSKVHKTSSQYRGVRKLIIHKPWGAAICHNGKRITIGYFETEEEAARAFDEKAKEFGRPEEGLNFPLR